MNTFTSAEVEQMHSILRQLQPKTVECIQTYQKGREISKLQTYGVMNSKRQYTYVFQYYPTLSPYRMKLLLKKAQKINYKLNVVTLSEKEQCVGWKASEKLL